MNVSYDELVSVMGGGEAGGELEDPDGSKWRGSESDLAHIRALCSRGNHEYN